MPVPFYGAPTERVVSRAGLAGCSESRASNRRLRPASPGQGVHRDRRAPNRAVREYSGLVETRRVVERGALAALAKLDRLLPPRLRAQLTALRAATVSLVSPTEVVSADCLIQLAQACDNHQRATFAYNSQDGRHSERRVEPHRLVATARRWYLVAYDLERNDWRTFRVDRVSALKVSGHTFVPRPLADPARVVAEGITTAPYAHRAVVLVKAAPEDVARLVDPYVSSPVLILMSGCCLLCSSAPEARGLRTLPGRGRATTVRAPSH